ncbi:ABC transporter substrate-binding protein [Lutibaculum baratangense]|uniref:ABC transporter substrate-binding protein n=1 Tax=Lutibaculum baratangense TaxID=1358440 RepID=UPI00058C5540|nr:ABC transporter substrate-binding protein [Lutibaculum baratangense]
MLRMLAAVTALTLSAGAVMAQDVTVAVTSIVEHPALDAVRDGVRDGLAERGFTAGENMAFEFQTAQGNPATAAQIARQYVGESPDVIVPISTPSAQAVVSAAGGSIPVVFSAVTDPVGAQLVSDLTGPGGNVTGVSDLSPISDHLALVREILPEARRLGVIFNSGEANSVALVEKLKEFAPGAGFEVVEATATRSSEVQQAALSLTGKVDAIYVPTDNTVISALEAAVQVAQQNRIPLFTADTDSVRRGAIAAVGFNYYDVGRQTAELVARILEGETAGDIPVVLAEGTNLVVNPAAAEAMGVELSPGLVARANEVIE